MTQEELTKNVAQVVSVDNVNPFACYLKESQRMELLPEVFLTLSMVNKGALVELGETKDDVFVDDVLVIDVAHLKMGKILRVGQRRFALLGNMDVFIKDEVRTPEKIEFLYKYLMENAQVESLVKLLNENKGSESEGDSEVIPLKPSYVTPKTRGKNIKSVGKGILIFFVISVSISIGYFLNALQDTKVEQKAEDSVAEELPVDAKQGNETATRNAEETGSVATPPPIDQTNTAEKKLVKLEDKKPGTEIAVIQQIKRGPLPIKKAKALSPAELQRLREKISEIELEARFDPDLAKKKLRELAKPLAKDSDVALRIQKIINSL